ncbi:VCBS repeat protein [Tamaricihabitans halophyticus]|uniref:VCBS repeat protein n=1 Tax=Tamaricihabitans halophyticus TaxID=1262583 RepID=A0A4R2R5J7_9PSEU|nr:VCBS repeat-containing protein [Tamaricihabitans halophyticus]TCP57069.1 VCBS repeat protein [Tamaricihabitans halophyticus]
MRIRRVCGVLGGICALAAPLVVPGLVVPGLAGAEPGTTSSAERVAHYQPSPRAEAKAAPSGGRGGDFTGDQITDMLTRNDAGALRVYPHSGTFDGKQTYRDPATIANGWGTQRWVGQGDLNADGFADALAVDQEGTLRWYPHTGEFAGQDTLGEPEVLGHGWNTTDLITTADLNGDGYDDMVAHRKGTGDTYVYEHTRELNGTATFKEPVLLISGPEDDVQQIVADLTGDGVLDVLAKRPNGELELFSFTHGEQGKTFTIGYGWDLLDAISVSDVTNDGNPDILGSRDGKLYVYPHSGSFDAANPAATLGKPVEVRAEWQGGELLN